MKEKWGRSLYFMESVNEANFDRRVLQRWLVNRDSRMVCFEIELFYFFQFYILFF